MTSKSKFAYRRMWLALAYASLALGLVGIFLPVMPTSPFVIVAAYAAARSSRRLQFRLLRDKHFGKMLRDWSRHGAIPRSAKALATGALTVSSVGVVWFSPWEWAAWTMVGVMAAVVLWLWTRPDPPRKQSV